MSKRFHGALAAVLAFVLVLSLFPTVALPAQAAEGDASSEGYVIFEETFDTDSNGALVSGHTYSKTGDTATISDGCLNYTTGTTNSYYTFTISDLDIPAYQGSRCYVGIRLDIFVKEATNRSAYMQVGVAENAAGTDIKSRLVSASVSPSSGGNAATSFIVTGDGYGIFYVPAGYGPLAEFTVRVGARNNSVSGTTPSVKIDGFRVSLVLGEQSGKQALAQDMGRYLIAGNGYFQLQRDMTFDVYTDPATSDPVYDLIMGSNAVLDLNGHTLTIAEGSTLSVPVNAKIVDSSAGKTGKIVCAKDALTIANTSHPTLPVWTGNGYVLTEPKLEADKHIMVVADSQNHDQFKLHLRPGFGTLSNGTVNVREAYLAGGNNGITMSAFITSVDLYGNRYNLQNAGSEEIVLDGMFDGMYASDLARCQIAFEGFEKYQALEITIKLSAMGVVYTLPTYTVENTYVTKHYASQFNYGEADYKIAQGTYSVTEAGKLSYTGGTLGFTLADPIQTGAGNKLVIEGDIDFASSDIKTGFEVRGTEIDNSNRYYLFVTNQYATQNGYHHVVQKNDIVGEKHIRLEIDLNTFAVVCTIDGISDAAVTPSAEELEYFLSAWNNKSVILASASGHSASTPLVFDNLLIYTIKTA